MTREDIMKELRDTSAESFISNRLFDRVPFAFTENRSSYIAWKSALAAGIDVDPCNIAIVGSAAIGISMNPNKNFKAFSVSSDIDVAVVSHYYFTEAWRFLRTNGALRAGLTHRDRASWDDHRGRLIYWGSVATDRLLPFFNFAGPWRTAMDRLQSEGPISNNISIRLYADFDSLRQYQIQSIKRAQVSLIQYLGV